MSTSLGMEDFMKALGQGSDGEDTYSIDKALYGYIAADKYFQIQSGYLCKYGHPPDLDVEDLGRVNAVQNFIGARSATHRASHTYLRNGTISNIEHIRVIMLNFAKLKDGGLSVLEAYLAAAFRGRWLFLGCMYVDTAARHVPIDEVTTIATTAGYAKTLEDIAGLQDLFGANDATVAAFRTAAAKTTYDEKFVSRWAETIWAISEFLFRTRGHHYKTEYKEMVQRMFYSATEGSASLDDNFPFFAVFHIAIHPFGIKALPVMAYHFVAHGKVGNAMVTRLSGAANGFAAATTASACLTAVEGEAWFSKFKATNPGPIDMIHKFSNVLLDHKYQYHLAADLYGVPALRTVQIGARSYTMPAVDQEVSTIAPFLQAFINCCPQVKCSLANAKVLQKRAYTNPLAVRRFEALIEFSLTHKSATLQEAIANAFPHPLATGATFVDDIL